MSVRLVLAIGLLALTGCGGGTDGTPAAPPPTAPTPAEPPPTPPGRPTGIRVVDVGVDFLVWAWDPVDTATGYEGHAFPDGTPGSERPPLRVTVEPTFRADGLEPGTVMVFVVRAIRETAGGRAVGPWSDPGTGETLMSPSPPMTVNGTVRASGGPASVVAGAVVRARNLATGAVDGEATTERNGSYAIEGPRLARTVSQAAAVLALSLPGALAGTPAAAALQAPQDAPAIHFAASGPFAFASARITVDVRLQEGARLGVTLTPPSGASRDLSLTRAGNRFSWTGQLDEAGVWRAEAAVSGAGPSRTARAARVSRGRFVHFGLQGSALPWTRGP